MILLTLAESGPLGVLAVLGVHFWVLWGMWRRRSGLKDLSAPWASSHALAGAVVLSKFVHGLVDHYWSRGAIMIAWASVGFALSASRISGARRRHAVLSPRLPLKKMVRAHKGKAAYA